MQRLVISNESRTRLERVVTYVETKDEHFQYFL